MITCRRSSVWCEYPGREGGRLRVRWCGVLSSIPCTPRPGPSAAAPSTHTPEPAHATAMSVTPGLHVICEPALCQTTSA
eukprot:410380-Rhodomonas_salina.1